jgi:LPS O-antigen subunit length determinant protein (WzzB/FepE family)
LDARVPPQSLKPPGDTVDFAEIGTLLRRRFWVIVLFAAAGTILALIAVFTAVPQFTATGALYLGDAQIRPVCSVRILPRKAISRRRSS